MSDIFVLQVMGKQLGFLLYGQLGELFQVCWSAK